MILWRLTLFFLKIGAFTFGGGMAMIPFIHQELVEGLHWLSLEEFSQAIALGQITPGPVAISATFIGFKLAGLAGAVAATIAVFLSSFLMTVWASQQLERLRSNRSLHAAVQRDCGSRHHRPDRQKRIHLSRNSLPRRDAHPADPGEGERQGVVP